MINGKSITATCVPVLLGTWLGAIGTACAPLPQLKVDVEYYQIEVYMDPASSRLVGHTVMTVVPTEGQTLARRKPVAVALLLHPDLQVTRIATSGVKSRYVGDWTEGTPDKDDGFTPKKHQFTLAEPVDAFTLFVDYEGKLYQDVAAGEKPGEIHNFAMRAHVGEDGIYLGDGYWYPQPDVPKDAAPALADFVMVADPVPGMELVAGAERDRAAGEATGRLVWRSPYPLTDMVLVGGRHEIHTAEHNGVNISVHLTPEQAMQAKGLIDAVQRYMDRYEPLIGPYPAGEYSVVDNFFSSGFAFPTFTLLSSAVINMGERSQRMHGFIDHEMLHCWWGNGVHVDPRDGNWCEALASYAANYYGYVLDGNEQDARRIRRNYSHFLSRIKPEDDKPLGTFDREEGCNRDVAYFKGAMVFHMLAQKIGQENFWAAMRRLTAEYVGRYATWEDLRRLCEEVSGVPLEAFFKQWVRGAGAPLLAIDSARYNSTAKTLTLALSQGETAFEVDVPIRVNHEGGAEDIRVALREAVGEIAVPLSVLPLTVELDPDFQLFRKVPLGDIIPTTATTRRGPKFASILPSATVPEEYDSLRTQFESRFDEDKRVSRTAGSIEEGALAERSVLILGEAVRDPYVAAFLSAAEFPVRFIAGGFEFEGVQYTDPADAILCTIRHPDVEGGGVTVVYANSEPAIPPARNIPMYDYSTVLFKDRRATLRRDFEIRRVVPVER